jgi:hypothetical protein
MKTKLLALSVGVAMLSGAGIAQAADVTPADAQSKAAPSARVELTDTQMQELTAGHYTGRFHRGWHYNYKHQWVKDRHKFDYGPEGDKLHSKNGKHRRPHGV